MSDLKREQLSSFVDGEIDESESHIADHLLKDQELMDTWSRYHLLSDCLNRQLPEYIGRNLSNDIAKLIQDEPTILAPTNTTASFMKPVVGFAIAASVTAMAILGVQQQRLEGQSTVAQQEVIPVNQNNVASRPSQIPIRQVSSQTPTYRTGSADKHRQLNRYIVNYSEYRTDLGMQGIIPYVRIVAHDNE